MNVETWQRVKEVFLAALEVEKDRREAFLNDACKNNTALRKEVESLLNSHEEAEQFIEYPAFRIQYAIDDKIGSATLQQQQRVGSYRILCEIGRGGMATVYLAERDDEHFKKKVAVKIIRRDSDTKDIIRRFRQERQILAQLEHPNIARLLDGGVGQEDLPYLVMEYVEGLPITRYCDENQLSVRERLGLFLQVCSSVHYAHQNLVIHRDIKPSNILVTKEGLPKLLDFGVAKLLQSDSLEQSFSETATALRVMTPEYASPEQVRGEKITTATDVYSLGVVLYELLTGHRPYRLQSRRLDEIARAICEEEPERPSTAISRYEEIKTADGIYKKLTPESVSGARNTEPHRLRRLLGGDLDNIVLMALRKEAKRRYASVENLSEDIHRSLAGLPVIARKDTFGYRASKFISRHKAGVATALLVTIVLLASILAALWQARIARNQARVAAAERDKARLAQAKAEQINVFLQQMLSAADPRNEGRDAKVLDVLTKAESQAKEELSNEPYVLAEVLHNIGRTYNNLAQYEAAERNLRASLAIYQRLSGDDNEISKSWCMGNIGDVLIATDRNEEAEPIIRQAIEIQRRFGSQTKRDLGVSLVQLGKILLRKGDNLQAEKILQEALAVAREAGGEENEVVLFALNELAILRGKANDFESAGHIESQIIPILRRMPEQKANLATVLANYGNTLTIQGKANEAETFLQESLELNRETYGEESIYIAHARANLGLAKLAQGRYSEAKTEAEKALAIQKKILPSNHQATTLSLSVIGLALTKLDQSKKGERFLRQALGISRKNYRADDWRIYNLESQLGECLLAQHRFADAESFLLHSYEKLKGSFGEDSRLASDALQRVVRLYEDWSRPEDAARYRTALQKSLNVN